MSEQIVEFGIDLGTTNSCVAFRKLDRIEILASDSAVQKKVIPTCVSFSHKDKRTKYGDGAINNSNKDYSLITNAKRFIGKKYSDIKPDIMKFYPFVKRGKDDDILFEVKYDNKTQFKTPIEIHSLFLEHIKINTIPKITKDSNVKTHAVICIPAVFQYSQREGTKQAAEKAGIVVDELLPEATAAALAYCYLNEINKNKCNVLVYDFGGGTFDVSIVHIENNELSIIASEGDSELGGEDITNRIIEYLIGEIRKKNRGFMKGYEDDNKAEDEEETKSEYKEESKEERDERINSNIKMLKKLRKRSEDAKISLSVEREVDVEGIDEDEYIPLSRTNFERLCEDIFQNTLNTVKRILGHCSLNPNNIDYIVLAGGSSRIPRVKKLLREYFVNIPICQSINPDEAIAYGAAVYLSKDEKDFKYIIKEWDKKDPFSFGIDLGTTFSCTAFYNYTINNTRVIAPISGGKQSIPSKIAFSKESDKILYGKSTESVSPLKYTIISDSKRYIGKDFNEINEEDLQSKTYTIVDNNGIKYEVEHNKQIEYYSPKDISSMILRHIKEESIPTIPGAENNNPSQKYPIVLTVPADFSFTHRQQTQEAAENAGFSVTALINEPTAASIAYVEKNESLIKKDPFHLLVYDLGGGTFDVSIVRIESIRNSRCKKIKVIWTDGINNLGGQDFTMELIKYIKARAKMQFGSGVNLNSDKAMRRIEKVAENAKINLSVSESITLDLDIDGSNYNEEISRVTFENMIKPYINRTIEKVKNSISSSRLSSNDIDTFVLTGGSSNIPLVKELLKKEFDGKIEKTINPDEAVAIGACLYAKNLGDSGIEHHQIIDVLSHSLGMEVKRLLGPTRSTIQRMLNRMSELPCEFTTEIAANKGIAQINIYEGESKIPSDNTPLGVVELNVSANKSSITVKFKANKDGNLEVFASVDGVYQRVQSNIFRIR